MELEADLVLKTTKLGIINRHGIYNNRSVNCVHRSAIHYNRSVKIEDQLKVKVRS